MATPSDKSPAMTAFLDSQESPIGISRRWAILFDVCYWCGEIITGFRDELSKKEYTISGFCQKCQDDTFGED